MNRLALVLLLCLLPLPAWAQDDRALTDDAAAAMAAFYNAPATTRLSGPSTLPSGSELVGDVAVLGGPFEVAGTIRGDVLVLNGDLMVLPGARITGRVTVVGGAFDGAVDRVAGAAAVYAEPLRFRREDGRIVALGRDATSWLGTEWVLEGIRLGLEADIEGAYNRVEGLPVSFGPRVALGRSNPTVLDARLVYRTQSGLRIHPDEFGHDVRLEQYLFGHRAVRVGVAWHRSVDPIEDRGIRDIENSLSTFVVHRDYRDHYIRRGWSGYLLYDSRTRPLDLGLEYRDENHGSIRPRSPWSLLNNDEPWRSQPQVAEGPIRTLRAWLVFDSRNDPDDPAVGWFIRAETEQGLEGDLRIAVPVAPDLPFAGAYRVRPVPTEFTTVHLDIRRYLRLGPRSRVALRVAAVGSPDDGALPPQRQQALGGEGSLPGYGRFAFDCGAREGQTLRGLLPYYGCDRSLLLQAEARFALGTPGGFSPGRWLGLDFEPVSMPELVIFADGGRAWVEEESVGIRETGLSNLRYDVGLGLKLGRLGLYVAAPLAADEELVNFFIRLGPRL